MHVAVVGPGAIGLSVGGLLARAGHTVTFVARPGSAARPEAGHVRVTGSQGTFETKCGVADRVPDDADLVVVTVKTLDLVAALEALPATTAPVVTVQNGLDAEAVAATVVPADRVVGCVTMYSAAVPEPWHVHIGAVGGLTVGRRDGAPNAAVHTAHAVLADAFPTTVTANLIGARWLKLLVNLNNAVPAATGLSIQEAAADARIARFIVRMMKEGAAVARAEGVRFEKLPWTSPLLVTLLVSLPQRLAAHLLASRVRRHLGDEPAYGSTHASVKSKQRSEIDDLNGAIVRIGRTRRLPVAANAAVQRAIRRVEADGRFWAVERLLAEERPED